MRRGKPLRQVGARAKRDEGRRSVVLDEARSRFSGTCAAYGLVPTVGGRSSAGCWGHLDGHEVIARSLRPGSHLEVELVAMVCRGHHGRFGEEVEEAREAGFYFSPGEYDEAVLQVERLAFRASFGRWPVDRSDEGNGQ